MANLFISLNQRYINATFPPFSSPTSCLRIPHLWYTLQSSLRSTTKFPRSIIERSTFTATILTQTPEMAFFARNVCAPDASFIPLLRLLDDVESYSRQPVQKRRHNLVRTFQPNFDVREVEDAYELYGELAGLNKDNVQIEFTDPQTLRIKGRVERSYAAGAPSGTVRDVQPKDAQDESDATSEKSAHSHHQPSVEDDFENVTSEDASSGSSATAEAAATPVAQDTPKEEPKPVDNGKYWVSERSIGQFSRTFHFPAFIQQDAVAANFQDGILTIRVPKTPKDKAHRHVLIN